MILLDTTILAYAVGGEHPLREPCQELVRSIGEGSVTATTTVEVIQEFAHIRSRRHGRADAASVAARYAELLEPLIETTIDDLRHGLYLFQTQQQLGAFDAVLAASAVRRAHITGLASADRAFADVPGIVHRDPADKDFLPDRR